MKRKTRPGFARGIAWAGKKRSHALRAAASLGVAGYILSSKKFFASVREASDSEISMSLAIRALPGSFGLPLVALAHSEPRIHLANGARGQVRLQTPSGFRYPGWGH